MMDKGKGELDDGAIAAFSIRIYSREHQTWQGVLQAGEAEYPFRSELELLLTMDRLLTDGKEEEQR